MNFEAIKKLVDQKIQEQRDVQAYANNQVKALIQCAPQIVEYIKGLKYMEQHLAPNTILGENFTLSPDKFEVSLTWGDLNVQVAYTQSDLFLYIKEQNIETGYKAGERLDISMVAAKMLAALIDRMPTYFNQIESAIKNILDN